MIDSRILTQHVYDTIRAMIVDGEVAPGEKINKRQLAEDLGVSQTPVSEALSRLAGEKYLSQVNRHGFYVRRFTPEDLIEMFEVRAGLEGIAIRLCAERATGSQIETLAECFAGFANPVPDERTDEYLEADKRFHAFIIELSGNSMIREMTESFGFMLKSYQPGLVRPPGETLPEHRQMIEAVQSRNGVHAQELMIQHFTRTAAVLGREKESRNGSTEDTGAISIRTS